VTGPADSVLAEEFDAIAAWCRLTGFPNCTADHVAAVYGQHDVEIDVELLDAIEERLWERGIW
jgi:hypothetical protein